MCHTFFYHCPLSLVLLTLCVYFGVAVDNYDSLRSKLALEAFRQHSNKNLVVSPLLLRLSLCKLVSFTQGGARKELLSALGIKTNSMRVDCYTPVKNIMSYFEKINLITLNNIIVNYTDDISKTFISNYPECGVRVVCVSYLYPKTSVTYINKGVDVAFYKRITDVLETLDINNQSSIILMSAAYFKVTWENNFDISYTKPAKFHHHDGKTSVIPMMSKTDYMYYHNDEANNIQIVNTKLASFGLTITTVVPRTSRGLEALLRKLSDEPDFLKGIYKSMRVHNIRVVLPRFKIKSAVDWDGVLKKIGLLQIFNKTNSGLNSILNQNSSVKHAYVSKCKQKAFIDVDEMGIYRRPMKERLSIETLDQRNPHVQIDADRPFYFTVNVQTDPSQLWDMYELFSGVYYGPDN